MPRPFGAHELSDGTLKYICLLAVFMGYRLPPFIALNEPETSLHPLLLSPLALDRQGIGARRHLDRYPFGVMQALRNESAVPLRRVIKSKGATTIEGLTLGGEYREEGKVDDDQKVADRLARRLREKETAG